MDSIDNLEDMMSCAICAYPFECSGERLPKMLPCQHTFCVQCLESVCKNDSIQCPMCRLNHKLAVEKLPQNLLLIQLISTIPQPSKIIERKVEKLKLEGGSSDDDDDDDNSSTLEESGGTIVNNEAQSKDYMDPEIAVGLLRSVLYELMESKFDEDNLKMALDCMRLYRESRSIAVLEEAAECLRYMQVQFLHRIPNIYYKEIAQEVLDTLQMVGTSTELRISCVSILFVFMRLKHPIFNKVSAITILFSIYDVENDAGVIEQGIMSTILVLCQKLTAADKQTLSTTHDIRKLIWIVIKKIHGGCYDSTLNNALTISLSFIDIITFREDFVANHGASSIALLLEKKLAQFPELCTEMIAAPKLTSNLLLHLRSEDQNHVQVVCDLVAVITNLLLVPKSQWESEEESADKYDTLVEELSFLFTSKTSADADFEGVYQDLLVTLYPLLKETEDEARKHFALSMMLRLCIHEKGFRYKCLILQARERGVVGELAQHDRRASRELKKIAVQLDNLLNTFDMQSDA